MAFVAYDPQQGALTSLVGAIFTPQPGLALVADSISIRSGVPPGDASSISFYDGATSALNIGAGLLITSGDATPPATNTSASYGFDTGPDPADAQLQGTVTSAFGSAGGSVKDPAYLQFQVNVTDASITGFRLDLVFGSDEFPEYSSRGYVDVAGVYVNGVNYALYGNSTDQPLAVLQSNVAAGIFRDNTGNTIPIEYDGVSVRLQVTAHLQPGINTIKIAVADTKDSLLDSGLFVANLQPVSYSGFGLSQQVAVTGSALVTDTSANQTYLGDAAANNLRLTGGLDVVDGGAGLDTVSFSISPGAIDLSHSSWNGQQLMLASSAGTEQLVNVERVSLAGGYYFALDTTAGGHTYIAAALLHALLNADAPSNLLSQWTAFTDAQFAFGHDAGDVGQAILDTYAPGASNEGVIAYLYQSLAGFAPDAGTVAALASIIGPGKTFETMGDMYAYASLDSLNTHEMAGFIGSIQQLDASYFG